MPVPTPDDLAPLLAPIPGASPAGRDVRYDPRYDAIREARREDDVLPDSGLGGERKVADWARVQKDAATLLTTESKDLQVAAWYTEALLHRIGIGGLAGGLVVLDGLLTEYWDGLFPEIEDGDVELRLGPLEWVGSRLDYAVRQAPVAPGGFSFVAYQESQGTPTEEETKSSLEKRELRAERIAEGKATPETATAAIGAAQKGYYRTLVADITAAIAALDALEKTSYDRFEDDPPSYRGLRAALDDVQQFAASTLAQKLAADPDPVDFVPEEVAAGGGSGEAGASGGAAGPLAPEPTSAADASARIAVSARYLRQQDAANPAPYLLLRGLRWGEVRTGRGQVDPRLLDAPAAGARTRLRTLLLDGKWPELLEASEQAMATPAGRGWLDLQRYTLTACARLGPAYDAVAVAVRGELRVFLAAVPQLLEATLMDDTPAANGETLDWLTEEGLDGTTTSNGGTETLEEGDSMLPDGSEAMAAALNGEYDGDVLAASVRGSAARRSEARHSSGRRRADQRHGTDGHGIDPFVLARNELTRGRTNRAVELLVSELERERSARGRFVRETQIAQIMVEAGLAQVAQPILAKLVETIDTRTLEEWEAGPLVAQPLALMCRVIDALDGDATERETLYLRVCRLDPLQAISLQPAAG